MTSFTLRPYQQEMVDEAIKVLTSGNPRPSILQASVGAGKSIVIAAICHELTKLDPNAEVLILQPSKELLEQNMEKLEAYNIDDIKVYSASMGIKEKGQYTMATIGSIKDKLELFKNVKYCLIDECFVAGTKVDGKNIEDIKVGDYVSSYNHITGKIESKRVRRVIKKPSPNKLYCISTQSGTIISTGNHEYFTQRGYVRADNMVEGDVVYEASLHDKEIRNGKNLSNMQENSQAEGYEPVSKNGAVCRAKGKNVVLQQNVRENSKGKKDARPTDVATRAWIFKEGESEGDCHKEAKRNRQTDMGKGCDKSLPQRRERKTTNHPAENSTRETWSGLDGRATNSNTRTEGEWQVSNMLQSGFGQPMANAGNRARRRKPQELGSKEEGRQEDCQIKPIRVDGITVLEQGNYEKLGLSDGGNYVYCITVEGNHNFFANGILVHNCDMAKVDADGMYQKFFDQLGITRIIGLTATPYKQRLRYVKQGSYLEQTATVCMLNRFPPIKNKKQPQYMWGKILYKIEMKDLQDMGYLAPIKYYSEMPKANLRINSTGGDYRKEDIEEFGNQNWNRILTVVLGVLKRDNPKRVLVFAPSVKASQSVSEALIKRGISADHIDGKTPKKQRSEKIAKFKSGETQVMCNCQCLTAGFDLPALDTIVYALPTLSPRVWMQAVGRGVRQDPNNPDKILTVFDLVGCALTIGRVENIRIAKENGFKDMLVGDKGRIDNVPLYKFRIPLKGKS